MVRLGEIRRKTAGGETLVLKRLKNKMGSSLYRYEIVTADGRRVEPDAGNRVEQARKEFERTVGIFREQEGSESQGETSSGEFSTAAFNVTDDLFGSSDNSGKSGKFTVF